MSTPMDQAMWRVASAADDIEEATRRVRAAVAEAHKLGASPSDLALAAHVTRQTIYRWLASEHGDPLPTRKAMREGVLLLATMVDPAQAVELTKRAHGDEQMLMTALRMGRAWLPYDAARTMSEEDRMVLGLAGDAENRVRARLDRG